jgi:hypothetical protein
MDEEQRCNDLALLLKSIDEHIHSLDKETTNYEELSEIAAHVIGGETIVFIRLSEIANNLVKHRESLKMLRNIVERKLDDCGAGLNYP